MIEDIEYLKENCEQDSTIIYIDSIDRDRQFYPTPEQYTVTFEQPFRMVNGFDILDASIPTTMWNVDKYNETLAITTARTRNNTHENAEIYLREIKDTQSFARLFERNHDYTNSNKENFIHVVSQEWYDAQNVIPSETITPFFFFVRHVIENVDIKMKTRLIDPNYIYEFKYQDNTYYTSIHNEYLIDILKEENFHITLNTNNLFDLIYITEVNVREADYLSGNVEFLVSISNYYKAIELGNYDITTLKTELNSKWKNETTEAGARVEFGTSASPDSKQGKSVISSYYFILINASIGRLIKQLGFDTYPTNIESNSYSVCSVRDNKRVFAGIYNDYSQKYKITSPGIVNLLGDRYIILRCPEIEEHLLGSFAYTNSTPGMGLFKLAAGYNDLTHLRFDFVNLVRKPFHPIGKLSKLSIRFETQYGTLYDFKGVNHQMLCVIKFLVPSQKIRFQKSLLNPNYEANYIKYMTNSSTIEYKEDSDNEQDFTDTNYEEKYKKEMQKYDYSSSDSNNGEDDTDDSEEEFDFSRR